MDPKTLELSPGCIIRGLWLLSSIFHTVFPLFKSLSGKYSGLAGDDWDLLSGVELSDLYGFFS